MAKKEAEKPKYKFPKTVGACLARLAELQDGAEILQLRLAPYTKEEAALREHMIAAFKKDQLKGAKGSGRSLSIVTQVVPNLTDWPSFFKFASRKGNDDLLQRSVKTDAWRERVDAGKEVPGVTSFTRVGLRVDRVRGG